MEFPEHTDPDYEQHVNEGREIYNHRYIILSLHMVLCFLFSVVVGFPMIMMGKFVHGLTFRHLGDAIMEGYFYGLWKGNKRMKDEVQKIKDKIKKLDEEEKK